MSNMCGRFTFQGNQWPELVSEIEKPIIEPNYNICPQDESPVIHLDSGQVNVTMMRWGLRPSWSKKSTMEPINARIESVESKPMFRDAYAQRRCLIPADGWYEWKTTPRGKVPFYHRDSSQSPILMAGIHEQWAGDGQQYQNFCLLTKESRSGLTHVHHRMPVLLDANASLPWLEEQIIHQDNYEIEVYPVGREVNKTSAQGVQLTQPLRTLFD
jgi:putative SOS response-associated peptidase YedK